jgi:hypothetical protein
MARKSNNAAPKLTDPELALLAHMEHGYRLEKDSLGQNPLLRRLKDEEVIRPMAVNRNTIKATEERGLAKPAKGQDPLAIMRVRRSKLTPTRYLSNITPRRLGSSSGATTLHSCPA